MNIAQFRIAHVYGFNQLIFDLASAVFSCGSFADAEAAEYIPEQGGCLQGCADQLL